MLAALMKKDRIVLLLAVVATIGAFVTTKVQAGEIIPFVAAAAALSLLAMIVGEATDHLGSKLGPGATGVLQSALGNLPELFVCIFALRAGLVEVVKGALIGSILANSMLVLGVAMLAGGIKNGTQRFGKGSPRMMSTLMLLASAALVVPTLISTLHTPAEKHVQSYSTAVAIVLLIVFGCSLPFFLKRDPELSVMRPPEDTHHAWPLGLSVGLLALSGVGAAFVSEWFVSALEPATKAMGISQAFSGLVVVAIAGNAIENFVGIQLAVANKMDYALSVILNSSLQIALALIPILVLLSMVIGGTALNLVLSPLLVVALILSSLLSAFIVYDGESLWIEGVALIGLYAVIVSAFWWG